mgnify:CR=1 FL=1
MLEMGYCKNGMNFHTGDSGIELYCLGVGDFKDYSIIDGTDQLSKISLNEMPLKKVCCKMEILFLFVQMEIKILLVGACLFILTMFKLLIAVSVFDIV